MAKASFFDIIKLVPEYYDELIMFGAIVSELKLAKDNHERAKIVVKAIKLITGQTATPIDDDVVELVEAVLNCPETKAAWDKLLADITKSKAA